jgi:hypothetical protein
VGVREMWNVCFLGVPIMSQSSALRS